MGAYTSKYSSCHTIQNSQPSPSINLKKFKLPYPLSNSTLSSLLGQCLLTPTVPVLTKPTMRDPNHGDLSKKNIHRWREKFLYLLTYVKTCVAKKYQSDARLFRPPRKRHSTTAASHDSCLAIVLGSAIHEVPGENSDE